jgi:hypothetical protein
MASQVQEEVVRHQLDFVTKCQEILREEDEINSMDFYYYEQLNGDWISGWAHPDHPNKYEKLIEDENFVDYTRYTRDEKNAICEKIVKKVIDIFEGDVRDAQELVAELFWLDMHNIIITEWIGLHIAKDQWYVFTEIDGQYVYLQFKNLAWGV